MNAKIDWTSVKLPPGVVQGVETLIDQLETELGDNLLSIILYGSAARGTYREGTSDVNLLIVLKSIDVATLRGVLDPIALSRKHGVAPMFLTHAGLASTTEVFPIKFLSMKEHYAVLYGQDMFESLVVDKRHLQLRCQQECLNLLMRLRRHYITSAGSGLSDRVSRILGGFLETLRMIVSLQKDLPDRESVIDTAANLIGFDATVLKRAEQAKASTTPLAREDAEALYDDFLNVVTQVARYIENLEKQ